MFPNDLHRDLVGEKRLVISFLAALQLRAVSDLSESTARSDCFLFDTGYRESGDIIVAFCLGHVVHDLCPTSYLPAAPACRGAQPTFS
jgi:hypothetical protein